MNDPDKPEIGSVIGYRILRLAALLAHEAKQSTKQLVDLPQASWRVLIQLAAGGEQNPNVIALELALKRSHVTQAVRELHKRGFIRERADAEDGRRVLLSLTAAGRKFVERGTLAFAPRREKLLAGLSPVERRSLDVALARITANAERMVAEADDSGDA